MRSWHLPLVRLLLAGLGRLSCETADRLGGSLGLLAWRLGIRRRVVADNLWLALGLRGTVRRQAGRQSYCTMGANFLQLFACGTAPDDFSARIEFLTPTWVDQLTQRWPSPVFLTLHLGCWDAAAASMRHRWGGLMAYATAQHDAQVDALINRSRRALGMEVIIAARDDRRGAVQALRGLRQGKCLGLLADQGPRPGRGTPAWFLGQATYCHNGPAFFALRTGHPIIAGCAIRLRAGRFLALASAPLQAEDETALTQVGLDCLSAMIARFPGRYFWQHRRFKYPAELPPRPSHPWRQQGIRLLVDGVRPLR